MKVLGVIPARYKSTRLPAKPLRDILQFADHHPEGKDDQAGACGNGPRKNQGIAETELLNRDAETDRQETGQ